MAVLTQRSNGRWQAKIRRKGHPGQSKTFATAADAKQWARAVEREMDLGAFVDRKDAERMTFAEAATRYMTEVLPRMRGAEREAYKIKSLIAQFGKYSLAAITPAQLSEFRDNRLKTVKPQTVVHDIGMVTRIYKTCTMDWGIALPRGIPTALVRKPKVSNARNRRLVTGEWELLSVALAECKSVYPLAVVEMAIETAARQSELMSLTWSHVNLEAKTIRLRGLDGGNTKNGDPYRDVPLSPRAIEVLRQLPRPLSDKDKVFPLSQNAMKLTWDRACPRARQSHVHALLRARLLDSGWINGDIDAQIRAIIFKKKEPDQAVVDLLSELKSSDKILVDLHFHDLRHEATSRLAPHFSMHDLMKITGHKSSAMLDRYYQPEISTLAEKLQ